MLQILFCKSIYHLCTIPLVIFFGLPPKKLGFLTKYLSPFWFVFYNMIKKRICCAVHTICTLYSKLLQHLHFLCNDTPPNFRVCARQNVPTKCSSETPKNLPYFIYTKSKTQIWFYGFSFRGNLFIREKPKRQL